MAEAALDYDKIKQAVKDDDPKVRIRLARDPALAVEFLYFLAEDRVVEVRRAVAGNPSTPNQADLLLSRDIDYSVRCALARKVVGEGLADDERRGLWRMGFTILETLACDEFMRVRRILAEAFKSPPDAPAEIVRRLARDTEREVAAPVLRHSPVLTDVDIIDIVANDAPEWTFEAVAGRQTVSPAVAEALTQSGPVSAVSAMIANPGAAFAEPTMAHIVERAEQVPEFHQPLVNRPSLSQILILKLARFVAAPLLAVLRDRDGLDAATAAELDRVAEDRGETAAAKGARKGLFGGRRKSNNGSPDAAGEKTGEKTGEITGAGRPPSDAAVSAALDAGDADSLIEGLAARAGYPAAMVRRMVFSGSARTITALCWKAGLTMRFALDVQRRIGHIPPTSLIYARDGVDYPLSPQDMTDQLGLFGG